jgi:hypothetical protein
MKKLYILSAILVLMSGAFVHGMEPAHNVRPFKFRIIDKALAAGDWQRVFKLLEATPELVNAYQTDYLMPISLVYYAKNKNDFLTAEMLFEKYGADPNGDLPYAIAIGDLKMIKFLLEHGANPDTARLRGKTARQMALMKENPEVLELIESFDRK